MRAILQHWIEAILLIWAVSCGTTSVIKAVRGGDFNARLTALESRCAPEQAGQVSAEQAKEWRP